MFFHWGLCIFGFGFFCWLFFLRDPTDVSRGVKSTRPPPSSLRVHRIRGDPVTKDIEEKNKSCACFFFLIACFSPPPN